MYFSFSNLPQLRYIDYCNDFAIFNLIEQLSRRL